jgi:AcrR family transcriptional regulator
MSDPQTKRGRGRPRSFDSDEALDAAIAVFWAKGYDATSLDDLSAAMGMGRPSIYRAFGSKEELFLKALTRYRETVGRGQAAALQAAGTVQEAITSFLDATVDYVTADPDRRGCLIASIAVVVDQDAPREFAASAIAGIEADVAARLTRAVGEGELPEGFDVAAGARRAADGMLALATRARLGTAVDVLRASVADRAALVLNGGAGTDST